MKGAGARRAALAAWVALIASVFAWPFAAPGTDDAFALVAGLPLLLPLPGIARGTRRTLSWAPLAETPALAFALMEVVANPAARPAAAATLALVLVAFAAVIAALRSSPRG
ncbi:MAG: DUF2069 domain-containing protein [Gammaproteobacteria bacterium]